MKQTITDNKAIQKQKARSYNTRKRLYGLAELSLGALYLLALLLTGWNFELQKLSFRIGGGPAMWVLVYFSVGAIIFELLALPLEVHTGYFLEKRYGLLHQSGWNWAVDLLKAQAVGLVMGLATVELLYLCLRWFQEWWWIAAGGVFALFFVILVQLTPVLILPIFFKFKPLPDSDLSRRLKDMCQKSGARVVGIFEWKMSDKTSRVNAALVGWGPTRRVVLSDSLLTDFTPSEVEVILAHEIGHHRLGHIWWLLAFQTAVSFAIFGAADLLFRLAGPYFTLFSVENVAGMPLLLLALLVLGLVLTPLLKYYSRVLEKQADGFALALTGLTGSFISAIERLVVLNLGEMAPHPLIEALFYSHPAPVSRIAAAKEFQRNERQGGGDAVC